MVRTKTAEHEIDLDSKRNDYGSSKNIIELKNLRKVYRIGEEKVVALDDITLDIKGSSAAFGNVRLGKSTLLNLMAGLNPRRARSDKSKAIEKMSEKSLQFRQEHRDSYSSPTTCCRCSPRSRTSACR